MNSGVQVRSVSRGSPFYRGGLRKGDTILTINDEAIVDDLDFHFFIAEEQLLLAIRRGAVTLRLAVEREEGDFSGVELVEQPIRHCTNRCIFCFIDQMPPGLRKTLYIKDEDVRLSVFNGNYVTLSNFSNRDLDHLGKIGLSPLYISVHSTDPTIRRKMLRNSRTPPVLEQLRRLAGQGIRFHTQIVVCPGWNDGAVLSTTIRDLLKLGESVQSIAVVPVGLTRFRSMPLNPVDAGGARSICRSIGRISDLAAGRDGMRKVFLADEFFIKGAEPIPGTSYYEDFPQIENGVGLVRQLIDDWNAVVNRGRCGKRKRKRGEGLGGVLLITSVSAYPFLQAIADELQRLRPEPAITVTAVVNRFFGETVTVAGLLTAADILREIRRRCRQTPLEMALLPSVLFNYNGYTLDGYSLHRMEKTAGIPLRIIDRIEELATI